MMGFALLPLFAVLIAVGYRRSLPADHRINHVDRIHVALIVWTIGMCSLASYFLTHTPGATSRDHIEGLAMFAAIALYPTIIWVSCRLGLRLVRRLSAH
jgi:hypothetical protein